MGNEENKVIKVEKRLLEQIEETLGTEVGVEDNLLHSGLTSIHVMRIMAEWKNKGCKIRFSSLLKEPNVRNWAKLIAPSLKKVQEEQKGRSVNMYEPFELTDVQYAYWIGREKGQYLGNVGCHGYFEVDSQNLDEERLRSSWDMLFEYHPMLRAHFLEDGRQVVTKQAYEKRFQIIDLSNKTKAEQALELEKIRKTSSHRLMNIAEGEVLTLRLSRLGDGKYKIHFDIDLLVCDVHSFRIILRDLADCYVAGKKPKAKKEWNFAEYLANDKEIRKTERIEAEKYWNEKITELPEGPKLPVLTDKLKELQVRFCRHEGKISFESAEIIRRRAVEKDTTLAAVMLTAYGYILSKFSENKKFLMNLPMFNRTGGAGIDDVVADFTNLLIVPLNFEGKKSFADYLGKSTDSFQASIDHSVYSGVRILRDLKKIGTLDNGIPFVFSCNLGGPLISDEFKRAIGDISFMITQTPQVLLDFQLFDSNDGGLHIVWDCVDEAFPKGMPEEIFNTFIAFLNLLGNRDFSWDGELCVHSASQDKKVKEIKDFHPEIKRPNTMIEGILSYSEKNPEKKAVVSPENCSEVSYGELVCLARKMAGRIKKSGIRKGEKIILIAERKPETIAAMIAIQLCGCAYIPIRPTQPLSRLEKIIESASVRNIAFVTEQERGPHPANDISVINLVNDIEIEDEFIENDARPEELAYIIFTSGSTGIPKGVAISHQAAMNTIDTINKQYGVGENDCAIGVSSFDFDLSVYDVFGMLNQGGVYLVVPDDAWRDASIWEQYVHDYNVTIWNSVPAIAKMLLTELSVSKRKAESIKRLFLSGDWCGLDVPMKVETLLPNAQLTVMGGATEASIWSNYIDVRSPIPKEWKSIPYGAALKNQFYRVVDEDGEDRPDWVRGELWIGGCGVAEEYVGDKELTLDKFTEEYGTRWYHTGDSGRIWDDGTIEFLGRIDNQVKVHGHRIEAGEIEAVLKECSAVDDTLVLASGNRGEYKLTAFFTTAFVENAAQSAMLPDYSEYEPDNDIKLFENCKNARSYYIERMLAALADKEIANGKKKLVENWKSELSEKNDKCILHEENSFIKKFMDQFINNASLLLAEEKPSELITATDFIAPGELMIHTDNGIYAQNIIIDAAKKLDIRAEMQGKELRVIEVGARNPQFTKMMLERFPDAVYTILDSSLYYLEKTRSVAGERKGVNYIHADAGDMLFHSLGIQEFDLIIFNNTLHQMANVTNVLDNMRGYLAKDGMLVFAEMAEEFPLSDLSIQLLSDGYTDIRRDSGRMLLSAKEWEKQLTDTGYGLIKKYPDKDGQPAYVYFAKTNKESYVEALNDIEGQLKKKLPSYMLPSDYIGLGKMPVTANGKIDRKALEKFASVQADTTIEDEKMNDVEESLVELWKSLLKCNVGKKSNYFRLGGDSLLATRLSAEIRTTFGVEFSIEKVFELQSLAEMAEYIESEQKKTQNCESKSEDKIIWKEDKDRKYEPFPLTDVQQAYWLGRTDIFSFGGMSTQCCFEMACVDLNLERAQDVLNKLIKAHDMLRAVVLSDGQSQRIMRSVPAYEIKKYDFSELEREARDEKLVELRKEVSHRRFEPDVWPLFDIRFAKTSENSGNLFIDFDNMLMDGWSMFYFMKEWKYVYDHPEEGVAACKISFRDYIISCKDYADSGVRERDWDYWKAKMDRVYPAPELSVVPIREEKTNGFSRMKQIVPGTVWQSLKTRIRQYSITPAAFLLSVYAEVIDRWSLNSKFSINLTNFNRHQIHPEVGKLLGDFTALTIHGIDMDSADSFLGRTKIIQEKMWQDLNHSYVSGVDIERYLTKEGKNGMMPVVYTCGLGLEKNLERNYEGYLGEMLDGLSYTSQVWLDNQVSEDGDDLVVSWDYLAEIFPGNMAKDMFGAYISLIENLGTSEDIWEKSGDVLDVQNAALRKELNSTDKPKTEHNMLDGFIKKVKEQPQAPAVIYEDNILTYQELDRRSNAMAENLREHGIVKGDVVGIRMKKGVNQIVAIIAIQKCGAAYLPLKYENPFLRNKDIIIRSRAKAVITDSGTSPEEINYKEELVILEADSRESDHFEMADIACSDIAYIIYTSGTTGVPKGVAIEHGAAMNTILDINERLEVKETDRTIAISDISFDLSVYDIFGMLTAGGTVVIPRQSEVKEPMAWILLLQKWNVTIWNTVPMYMQMLTTYLIGKGEKANNHLRAILMSGDWIPLALKDEINEVLGKTEVYGLGGATEASIWSNIFHIEKVEKDWISIPYGKPLANQRYYVYDRYLRDMPNNVPGDLYIAGDGLARCYWMDSEATDKAFLRHPVTGERIYRTGDIALYMDDGNIRFCGRNDGQVKINGFRIELGEVDSRLKKHDEINEAVSIVKEGSIYSFIVGGSTIPAEENIIGELSRVLPEYMLPSSIIKVDRLPLSSNGKVNRKVLSEMIISKERCNETIEDTREMSSEEKEMSLLWKEYLSVEHINVHDSFIALGGDSLTAVKLVNAINQKYNVEISLNNLYTNSSVRKITEFISSRVAEDEFGEI
ncbi:MAG: amino acid adenylation domain-containing protein [Butyrivibrio sp.]|nr:amino acid adenylation domain-containing protein [Butyrivibrio sp.]